LDKAKAVYEEFLRKYPEDEFAGSAQFLLDNLGKSDDELLEALQKKGGKK
jgi:TolA-binding protein